MPAPTSRSAAAREALAEIDRAKTAFFSNVSHEFRTPLTLMLGPLEDALRHAAELPDDRLAELKVAHRNALRLLQLVNTLLDFSRVEAGRVQVNLAKTDLAVLTARSRLELPFRLRARRTDVEHRLRAAAAGRRTWTARCGRRLSSISSRMPSNLLSPAASTCGCATSAAAWS